MDASSRVFAIGGENEVVQQDEKKIPYLPDEIMLRIIGFLSIMSPTDMKCLKALGLVSRRMNKLTHDQTTVNKMIDRPIIKYTDIYPNTIWGPRTLWRFSKAMNQMLDFSLKIWPMWWQVKEKSLLPVRHPLVVLGGLGGFMSMDGLEDNAPNYALLDRYPNDVLVAMLATALTYEEVFLNRYYVVFRDHSAEESRKLARKVLRYIVLTKGPLIAQRILENPHGLYAPGRLPDFDQSKLQIGQKLCYMDLSIKHELPQFLWSLTQAVSHFENSNTAGVPPAARIDLRLYRKLPVIMLNWIHHGRNQYYFGLARPDPTRAWTLEGYRWDLVSCLRVWQMRNPFL